MTRSPARAGRRVAVVSLATAGIVAAACGGAGDASPNPNPLASVELASTATATSTSTSTTTSTTTTTTTTTTLAPGVGELAAVVEAMTLEEKARQLVVSGARGAALADAIDQATGSLCVGGIFVTDANANWLPTESAAAAAAAIGAVGEAAEAEHCVGRPLILTDAELGSVLRVPIDGLDSAPTFTAAFTDDAPTALDSLTAQAEDFVGALAALGVHVNFGVVADVDLDPSHYMARRGRTFGADPTVVSTLSAALAGIHCAGGVAPTLKHFPNQGATPEDPHTSRSTAAGGEEEWREGGRLPYAGTGAPVVMTGHIFIDTDPALPASMSPAVTTGLLRDDLRFDGVVVTDDLFTMQGVADVIPDVADRAVGAIAAGADLALFVVEDELQAIVTAIADRAATDPAFATRVDESVERVLQLKAPFGLVDELDPAWFPLCG